MSAIPSQPVRNPLQIPHYPLLIDVYGHHSKAEAAVQMKVADLVSAYLKPDEQQLVERAKKDARFLLSPLPSTFIDLSNLITLKKYVSPALGRHLSDCHMVASSIYQVGPRIIASNRGLAFSMHPEVLAYAMQRMTSGGTVVELAGASGENGIMMAFSGATNVYVNDIDAKEMARFEALRDNLPPEVAKKLEAVNCDCCEFLKERPALRGEVDFVLCRAAIHFFPTAKRSEFLAQLRDMLKPGGMAIITANAVYPTVDRETLEKNPDSTAFEQTQCIITDYAYGRSPRHFIYTRFKPTEDSKVSASEFQNFYIYTRDQGEGWKVDNTAFKKVDAAIRPLIRAAIDKNKDKIASIQAGSVRVLVSNSMLFSLGNLTALFEKAGFEIVTNFATQKSGHLSLNLDPFEGAFQVGVVVRKPLAAPTAATAAATTAASATG